MRIQQITPFGLVYRPLPLRAVCNRTQTVVTSLPASRFVVRAVNSSLHVCAGAIACITASWNQGESRASFFSIAPPDTNLVDVLRFWTDKQPGERAYGFYRWRAGSRLLVTYATLDAKARAIAARLQGLNLQGERALLLYGPGLDFVAGFLGCLYAGMVAIPAYPPARTATPRASRRFPTTPKPAWR